MWVFALFFSLIQFIRLRQFQDPTGADGYFYLKQIQSLSEHGQFYYKDYSLSFLLPSILNLALHDPLLSFQLATCLCLGVTAWLSERVFTKLVATASLAQRLFVAALFGVMIFNPDFSRLSFLFLKTSSGLAFLMAGLLFVFDRRWALAIGCAVAAILCHKIFVIFAVIAGVAILFAERKTLLAAAAGASIVLGLLIYPKMVSQITHASSQFDYSKFSTLAFSLRPHESTVMIADLLAAMLAFIFLVRRSGPRWLLALAIAFLIAPAVFPDSLESATVSFRLLVVSVPFFWIVVSRVAVANRWFWPVLIAFVALGLFDRRGRLEDQIFPWSQRIPDVHALTERIPADALIYAPHGVEFYIAYRTSFRPRSFLVDPKGRETYRIAFVGPYLHEDGEIKDDLENYAIAKMGNDFRVYTNKDWNALNDLHRLTPLAPNLLQPKPDFIADY